MRIAFFGGTFDPPHQGHTALAFAAIERFALDRVVLAPVAVQPLKPEGAEACFADRLAMVELVAAADKRLAVSTVDGPQPGGRPNYTLESMERFKAAQPPGARLFFLTGADALFSLKRWRDPARLLLFCDWIVAARPGFPLARIREMVPEEVRISGWKQEEGREFAEISESGGANRDHSGSRLYLLRDFSSDISATEVRRRLAEGEERPAGLDPQVARYIHHHRLYQRQPESGPVHGATH